MPTNRLAGSAGRAARTVVAAAFLLCAVAPADATDTRSEEAGPNLLRGGDFEGDALRAHWKWSKNKGGFKAVKARGHGGGSAVALRSTRTEGRGKFWVETFRVPAGADLRVSLWARAEGHLGGTWVNYEGQTGEGFARFDLAGGTHDWIEYTHRATVPTSAKFAEGELVNLSLWFYMYGEGRLFLDDIECRLIGELPAVEDADVDRRVRSAASAASGSDNWGVLATHGLRRILRDQPFRGPFSESVAIDVARREFEGAQVLIFAQEELRDVSVTVGDLVGPGPFDGEHVQVLPVAYGDRSEAATIPWYQGPSSPHWPDPLLPNRAFTVEAGTLQPVYLRVDCPAGTAPGTYRGEVTIATSSGDAMLPLIVRVRDVTLPVRLRLKTMLVSGRTDDPYLDLSLEQRMGLGNIANGMSWAKINLPEKRGRLDFAGVEARLQYAIDRGLSAFVMASVPKSGKWGFPKTYSKAWRANMTRVLREYGGWLEKKGWLDMAYFNNIDEPGRGRWEQCKDLYRMAKKANRDVSVFQCVNEVGALDALKGFADTWDVYVQQAEQQQAAAREGDGDEIWWAICIWPRERPNLFVENRLIDARIVGWSAFKYDVSGFEYWNMTSWGKNAEDASWITCPDGVLTTAWMYRRRWSGDGYLAYPGPDGRPVNSLRFEALRDGLEENELLRMLRDAASKLSGPAKREARRLLEDGDGAVTNMFLYESDPTRLLARRARILDLLEEAGPRSSAGGGQR